MAPPPRADPSATLRPDHGAGFAPVDSLPEQRLEGIAGRHRKASRRGRRTHRQTARQAAVRGVVCAQPGALRRQQHQRHRQRVEQAVQGGAERVLRRREGERRAIAVQRRRPPARRGSRRAGLGRRRPWARVPADLSGHFHKYGNVFIAKRSLMWHLGAIFSARDCTCRGRVCSASDCPPTSSPN